MGLLCMRTMLCWWQTQGMELQTVGGGSSLCDEVEDEVQQQKEQNNSSWEEGSWNGVGKLVRR